MGNAQSTTVAPDDSDTNDGGSMVAMKAAMREVVKKSAPLASDLFTACRRGDLVDVKHILTCPDVDVNMMGDENSTPLMVAIQNNFPEIVELLLAVPDVDLYHANYNGATVLLYASMMGFVHVVEMLIKHPDPDWPISDSNLQISRSVFNPNFNKIHDACPLSIACINNQVKIVSMFANAGCDINGQFRFEAWTSNSPASANSPFTNLTPLHLACSCGSIDVIKELIARGVDVSALDDEGVTALFHCVRNLNESQAYEILNLFKQSAYGIPKDALTSVEPMGNTLLHIATERSQSLVCTMLLQEGCNVNRRNVKTGLTPLHIAIKKRNSPLVSHFLQNGSDPLIPDAKGVTCQSLVEKWNKSDVIYAKVTAAVDAWSDLHRKHEINNITEILDLEADYSSSLYSSSPSPRHTQTQYHSPKPRERKVFVAPKAPESSATNDFSSSALASPYAVQGQSKQPVTSSKDAKSASVHGPPVTPNKQQLFVGKYRIGDRVTIGNSVNKNTLPATVISAYNSRNGSYRVKYENDSEEFVSLVHITSVISQAKYDPVVHDKPYVHLPILCQSLVASETDISAFIAATSARFAVSQMSTPSKSIGAAPSNAYMPPPNRPKTAKESLEIDQRIEVCNSINNKIVSAVIKSPFNYKNESYFVRYDNNSEEFVSPKYIMQLKHLEGMSSAPSSPMRSVAKVAPMQVHAESDEKAREMVREQEREKEREREKDAEIKRLREEEERDTKRLRDEEGREKERLKVEQERERERANEEEAKRLQELEKEDVKPFSVGVDPENSPFPVDRNEASPVEGGGAKRLTSKDKRAGDKDKERDKDRDRDKDAKGSTTTKGKPTKNAKIDLAASAPLQVVDVDDSEDKDVGKGKKVKIEYLLSRTEPLQLTGPDNFNNTLSHKELVDSINMLCKQSRIPLWEKQDIIQLLRYMDPDADSDLSLLEVELAIRRFHAPSDTLEIIKSSTAVFSRLEELMDVEDIRVRDLFYRIDVDKSNRVSFSELRKALMSMFVDVGHALTSEQIDQIIGFIKTCCIDASSRDFTILDFESAFRKSRSAQANRDKDASSRGLMEKFLNLLHNNNLTVESWFLMTNSPAATEVKEDKDVRGQTNNTTSKKGGVKTERQITPPPLQIVDFEHEASSEASERKTSNESQFASSTITNINFNASFKGELGNLLIDALLTSSQAIPNANYSSSNQSSPKPGTSGKMRPSTSTKDGSSIDSYRTPIVPKLNARK